jgi:hypothetical protein
MHILLTLNCTDSTHGTTLLIYEIERGTPRLKKQQTLRAIPLSAMAQTVGILGRYKTSAVLNSRKNMSFLIVVK